jgi:pilus assembly protein CpaF
MPDTTNANTPVEVSPQQKEQLGKVRRRLVEQFSKQAVSTGDPVRDAAARQAIEEEIPRTLRSQDAAMTDAVRTELVTAVVNELFGFGPIQPLLDDATVTEVMVNRADRVYVERSGKTARTTVTFDDDEHVNRIIERILKPLGKKLDANNLLVDARLPDGSRVNVVVPPVAIAGPCVTIRKFSRTRLGMDDLVRFGTLTPGVAGFLTACVQAHLNIVVCGGTGSGKTTLLNILSGCIGAHERIVTIEDAAELKLNQDHVITLEAKRGSDTGGSDVSIRELVRNALRMRPERIVVGECRGAESLDMLQAMNTGHDGSLTTLHANSPRDAISRIETMALMAGIDFPVRVIREQIGSAIHLLVHQSRMRDGSRKITHVTEIAGMEGDKVLMQELFRFKEIPTAAGATVQGALQPMGLRPQFMHKFEAAGLVVPPETFSPGAAAKYRNAAA